MVRQVFRLVICAVLLMPAVALGDVTVSAAISLKAALEKAQPELEKAAGEKVVFNFGASGTLAGQIQQGAPVDLFISADRATADKLVAAGAADKASEKAIAGNELVLIWSLLSSAQVPKTFAEAVDKASKLAIGDPKVVPAGAYAKETLASMKRFDAQEKSGKLVTTENVAQVLAFVRRGEAEAGIVYATDAATAGAMVTVVATAEATTHSPIEYVGVTVSASKKKDAAAKIQQALVGEKVQGVMKGFGFTAPPAAKRE
jgi:molybdate transport system substrate-binding protein